MNMDKQLLLLSNSTNAGEKFLAYPEPEIKDFLGGKRMTLAFFPFAIVTRSFDYYAQIVSERFENFGHRIRALHLESDPAAAVADCDGVVVGGGNTFQLLNEVYARGLMDITRSLVEAGKPYIGWSAGSNLSCPTIKTTNDMPIVEPPSFQALNLIPFQINPHYLDAKPEGHGGESREDRINEFIRVNQDTTVVGLREGTLLRIEGDNVQLIGKKTMRRFRFSRETQELESGLYQMDELSS